MIARGEQPGDWLDQLFPLVGVPLNRVNPKISQDCNQIEDFYEEYGLAEEDDLDGEEGDDDEE